MILARKGLDLGVGGQRCGDAAGGAAGREGSGMIVPSGAVRVLVATRPVKFRKGMDGLAALVRESLGCDCQRRSKNSSPCVSPQERMLIDIGSSQIGGKTQEWFGCAGFVNCGWLQHFGGALLLPVL